MKQSETLFYLFCCCLYCIFIAENLAILERNSLKNIYISPTLFTLSIKYSFFQIIQNYCISDYRHLILFHFSLLHATDFCKLKVRGNLVSSKSVGTAFPTAFVHFMSLCRILEILNISNFSIIIVIFIMVICDQWSLMLPWQKDYDLLKAQMMVSIS